MYGNVDGYGNVERPKYWVAGTGTGTDDFPIWVRNLVRVRVALEKKVRVRVRKRIQLKSLVRVMERVRGISEILGTGTESVPFYALRALLPPNMRYETPDDQSPEFF